MGNFEARVKRMNRGTLFTGLTLALFGWGSVLALFLWNSLSTPPPSISSLGGDLLPSQETSWLPSSEARTTAPRLRLSDPLPANLFTELARVTNPTVVNISTSQQPRPMRRDPRMPRDPFFDFFEQFMQPSMPQRRPAQALGSGFIIRKDGLIITNNHVIDRADVIQVQLNDQRDELFEAKVVGRDARTDIALIKISVPRELPVAPLGNSSDLQVGEWVAAFGNPYGHGHTMTKGIISAIGREIDEINLFPFLQTDASINPGNSGGPLVDSRGLVIGVNTAIDARAQGIGFAIPIDFVKDILEPLESEGRVRRGFLGVQMTPVTEDSAKAYNLPQKEGALVVQVVPDSPAAKAGIEAYDLIVEFNGRTVSSPSDLTRAVAATAVNQRVEIKLIRSGQTRTLNVRVGEHPQEVAETPAAPGSSYEGQKAPFELGFKVADHSRRLSQELNLPRLSDPKPIVIEVEPNSPAARSGLSVGDIILDVNRTPVRRATDVLRHLKKDQRNGLRILRGQRVILIFI